MAFTKSSIIEAVMAQSGFTKTRSIAIVETLLELMKRSLESGDDILVSGFGKFCVKSKQARRGRNPATREDLVLPARKVVTFKCSGKLRNHLNGAPEEP